MTDQKAELKKSGDILKHFGKILNAKTEDTTTEDQQIPEDKRIMFMDNANICCIIPKTYKMLKLMENNFDFNTNIVIPKLDYFSDGKTENKCKYNSEYLKIVLELAKHYDKLILSLKSEYPLRVETEDFIFILAPIVESD